MKNMVEEEKLAIFRAEGSLDIGSGGKLKKGSLKLDGGVLSFWFLAVLVKIID